MPRAVFFVVVGKRLVPAGVVPADEALVAWLRTSVQAPALLVANKAERRGNTASNGAGSSFPVLL